MPPRLIGPRRQTGSFYKKRPTPKPRVVKGKALTQEVKRIIKTTTETKWNHQNQLNYEQFNASIGGNPLNPTEDIYTAMPTIEQGDDSFQRIGEVVSPLYGYVDYHIGFDEVEDINVGHDITAHVFMLRCKSVKTARLLTSIPIRNLMDFPGGGQPFDGTINRAFLPVNKSDFTVLHHKKVRLIKNSNTTIYQGPIQSKQFRLKYKCAKLKYDQSLDSLRPSNDFVFWVIGFVNNFQGPASVPGYAQVPLRVTTSVGMYYKDD